MASADLFYGKIELKPSHGFSCFFIVEHTDEKKFIMDQAIQLLLAGCRNFDMSTDTYKTTKLFVPISDSSVCRAADLFCDHIRGQNCAVRFTGLKDRIFALRFFGAIPFYAYHETDLLKEEYDNIKSKTGGAGLHLYAKTGRGTDGSGDKDWVNSLPDLIPYSIDPRMTENVEEKIKLYNKACELGIIGPEQGDKDKWLLKISKPIDEKEYTVEEFIMVDAEDIVMLNKLAIASERSNIEAQLEHMWEEKNLDRTIIMKNDGYRKLGKEVADRVRLDYFLSYPSYQAIAKEEIRKYDVLCGQLKRLDEIRSVNLNSGIAQTLQFDHVYVSDGTEMMTVYPEKFLSWAWSDARNNWVSLTPAMRVWQDDAWQPIRLDRQGNIIIINENADESF